MRDIFEIRARSRVLLSVLCVSQDKYARHLQSTDMDYIRKPDPVSANRIARDVLYLCCKLSDPIPSDDASRRAVRYTGV